jgi:tetratricopeptide (TPR) repeat protein
MGKTYQLVLVFQPDIFANLQDYFDWSACYNLMQTCRSAHGMFQDQKFWVRSLRRRILVAEIPLYINWRLRTVAERQAIDKEIMKRQRQGRSEDVVSALRPTIDIVRDAIADLGEPVCFPELSTAPLRFGQFMIGDPLLQGSSPTLQAKITFLFAKGIQAYEAKDMNLSISLLGAALDLAPLHDIILCRLADAKYGEINSERRNSEGEMFREEENKVHALYKRALELNPFSSYGYNGLGLFEEKYVKQGAPGRVKESFMLTALLFDPNNSYALANLGMCESLSLTLRIQLLERALAVNENLFYARPALARAYYEAATTTPDFGLFRKSIPILEEHVRRNPADGSARENLRFLGSLAQTFRAY